MAKKPSAIDEKSVTEAKSLVERAIRTGPQHMILVFKSKNGQVDLDMIDGGFPLKDVATAVDLLKTHLANTLNPTPTPPAFKVTEPEEDNG